MANLTLIFVEGAVEPTAFGLNATVWVSIAMLVFLGILVWKGVPAAIAAMLDKRIAEISKQLDEAERLRLDAESLKAEYEAKLAGAVKEAADMRARAESEAETLVAKAKADATALIGRRKQMAEDRIAAAEATALTEVRAATAKAATATAAALIAEKHDAAADKALVDQAIAGVAKG
jgi:F-type H+-transporting ATPase subunit b